MIFLSIPTNILPLALQSVLSFNNCDTMLEVSISLQKFKWSRPPIDVTVNHPQLRKNFVGYNLIQDLIPNFFSPRYNPRQNYKSAISFLACHGKYTNAKLNTLIGKGFDYQRSETALILAKDDINLAREKLRTGLAQVDTMPINSTFAECPLLYFVLEIIEVFLDLPDHCCICRTPIQDGSIKPLVCNNPDCARKLEQNGIISSVIQEIKRDPLVADLLISCFSAAIGSQFLNPSPPPEIMNYPNQIANLPPINNILRLNNDAELRNMIGDNLYALVKWIILSNKSHFIHLPRQMMLQQIQSPDHFLAIISSPQREYKFRALKARYGSMFLWHGSEGKRWYPILRNGLRNLSGTNLMRVGQAHGAGIYLGQTSSISSGYVVESPNNYRNSSFGQNLSLIALCEVARVPELKNHGSIYTCTNEDAVNIRFVFTNPRSIVNVDTVSNPLVNVPSLRDVLNFFASQALQNQNRYQ